jgi:cell division protein ZapA
MSSDSVPVTVRIMEKEFCVACSADERDSLLASARYLDGKMREIRDSRKVVGMDRIAIICALNLAHELLQNKAAVPTENAFALRLKNLHDKIEAALQKDKQLEL